MPGSRRSSTAPKRALNVSVRADLIDEARAFGTNVSAVVEEALEAANREKRREKWRTENRAAVQACNEWVEEHGIPFRKLRPW